MQVVTETQYLTLADDGCGKYQIATKVTGRDISADTITVIATEADLEALKAEWRGLEAAAPDVAYFYGYDWCQSWWNWFGRESGRSLAIVVVRRGDTVQAILPLTIARTWLFASARIMGDDTGQYADCLVRPDRRGDPELSQSIAAALKRLGVDRITLTNCREDSAILEILGAHRRGKSWICAAEHTNVEVRPAEFGGFEDYMSTRSSNLRKGLRRRRRNLSKIGEVTHGNVTDPNAFDELAKTVHALKLDWLKQSGLHGRFLARPGLGGWMADIMHRAQASGQLCMSVLWVGEQVGAAQLSFRTKTKVTGYFSAFDISFSPHAVGKLHLESYIEDVFERDLILDVMPPSDSYKLEWGVDDMKQATYTVPLSRAGALVSKVYNVKTNARAKSLYLRMPAFMRAATAAAILDLIRRAKRAITGPDASARCLSSPLAAHAQKD